MIDYKKHLSYQTYGKNLLLFIKGVNDEEAYKIWLAMFNAGAVGELESEPKWVNYGVYSCWVTPKRLKDYLYFRHVLRLTENGVQCKGKKGGIDKEARTLAEKDFAAIPKDSYRSIGGSQDSYEFGTIAAEKPDEDFQDVCWKYAMKVD